MAVRGEVLHEQAHADWAVSQIDVMLERLDGLDRAPGDKLAADAIRRMQATKRDELSGARTEVIFGRLDMVDDADPTFYVGKTHIDGDDLDHHAVLDWRAPIGSIFYQANRAETQGVGRRRTIRMRGATVTGISDEALTKGFTPPRVDLDVTAPPAVTEIPAELLEPKGRAAASTPVEAVPVASLEGELDDIRARDLLLEELDRARDGEMHEIVATIQADQDRIIRTDPSGLLIVQGGPGTGKTVVGLHRAAWVLYEQRGSMTGQSVLVVGPSERFLDYVKGVLPSLGEGGRAQHVTVNALATWGLQRDERQNVVVEGVDEIRTARVKGNGKMAEVVERAVWSQTAAQPLQLPFERYVLRLSETAVARLIGDVRKTTPYGRAREELEKRVVRALLDQLTKRRKGTIQRHANDRSNVTDAVRRMFKTSRALEAMLPNVEPRAIVRRLFEDEAFLKSVAGSKLSATERAAVARKRRRRAGWTAADLPLIDEAAWLIRGSSGERFGHVVVDEAQELSPMQWRVIKRHTAGLSMTVLGDLAQSTAARAPESWSTVVDWIGAETAPVAELTLGYRVPAEIIGYAGRLLPEAAPVVVPPRSFRSTEAPRIVRTTRRELVDEVKAAIKSIGDGAVAVIVPPVLLEPMTRALSRSKAQVVPDDQTEGLEFDRVIVVEPSKIARDGRIGLRRLYVALTRATKTLTVVHSTALPGALRDDVSPDVTDPDPEPSAAVDVSSVSTAADAVDAVEVSEPSAPERSDDLVPSDLDPTEAEPAEDQVPETVTTSASTGHRGVRRAMDRLRRRRPEGDREPAARPVEEDSIPAVTAGGYTPAMSPSPALPPKPTGYSAYDEYIAQRTRQGDRYHYAIALPLVQVPVVLPVPDPSTPLDDNRQVRLTHAQGFADYVRDNADWHAGPLTVRSTSGLLGFGGFEEGDYGTVQLGLLRVPRNARTSFRIVDGQHRVLGIDLLLRQLNEEHVEAMSVLDKARRNGEPQQAIQVLTKRVDTVKARLDRVQQDSIFVDLIIEDSPEKGRQIFVDVANNALGISKAVTKRFDMRLVVNRALNLVLDDDIPLLRDMVDEQNDRITGSNPHLIGAGNVGDIVRILQVGIAGKVTKVLENTLDEKAMAETTADFFEVLTEAIPEFSDIADGTTTPDKLRGKSLAVSVTMLRVLAGVFHELAERGHSSAEISPYFARLAPHLKAPVSRRNPSGKMLLAATVSEAFSDGATAPGARAQQVKELVAVLADWFDKPPAEF